MVAGVEYAHLYTAWDKQWDYAATRIRSHEFVVTLTIHVLRASSAIFNVMQGALRHSQLRVTHWLQAVRLIMRKWLEHDPTELVVQHLSAWAEKCFR